MVLPDSSPTDPARSLLHRLERSLAPWRGRGVVVGVSGGSDSVSLGVLAAHLAPRLALQVSLAHFHHGARGAEADADAAFVADLAVRLDLPFDLGRWTPARSTHFEADARSARYDWLARAAASRGAAAVAVAHTLDDQAETVLHHIVRGTGLRGLSGMPARRPLPGGLSLIRPLLAARVTRAEARSALVSLGQPWREDATNADPARTRARIRNELLPALRRDYNPRVDDALIRLADLARQSLQTLEPALAQAGSAALLACDPSHVAFDRPALAALPLALRSELIRRAWARAGWPERGMSAARWLRLARAATDAVPGRFAVGAGVEAWPDASRLVLRREPSAPRSEPQPSVPLPTPGAAAWPGGRIVARPDVPAEEPGWQEKVDLDRLHLPLWVRPPAPGDRFDPLGLDGHSRPLADLFRGHRVPPDQRRRTPLVCDQAGIVWVVGHRLAHRVRRVDTTVRLLGLRWELAAEPGPAPVAIDPFTPLS